jgi:exopolyphosphatase/guanosine-5'-triphosphate,3'-diphosphate pyrophosphatase
MRKASVAILDIGSNSIKVLVAARAPGGRPAALFAETIDARISAGISRKKPRLGRGGMARGIAAIRQLLAWAAPFAPRRTLLVATSAVRDAANGAVFRRRVRAATGHPVRILTGREEAGLIGRGLACDPALTRLRNFYVFDLGGGSLECLSFRRRRARQAVSLPLGCVRLTEKFVAHPERPFSKTAARDIAGHVRATLAGAGFAFALPTGAAAVGSGGTLSTVRAIRAKREGIEFDRTDPSITLAELRRLLAEIGGWTLVRRKKIPGLPPARADVFPAALATLIAVAELGGFDGFRHSLYNLRWGVAADELSRSASIIS